MTRARKRRKNRGSKVQYSPSSRSSVHSQSPSELGKPVRRFPQLNTNPNLPAIKPDSSAPSTRPYRAGSPRLPTTRAILRRETRISETFSGPLPPPQVLMQYNQAARDGANRILTMAEEQARHRQRMEWHALTTDARRSDLGLASGFVVAIAFLAGSIWLGLAGHDRLAEILGGGTLVALAGTFVTGTIVRRNERLKKAEMVADKAKDQPSLPTKGD